jgi:hypothetical protein
MRTTATPQTRRCAGRPAIAVAAAIALVVACREPSAPHGPEHPAVGTYDFTTRLDTFTYFTGHSPFDHATIPAGVAALSGTFVVEDSGIIVSPTVARLPAFHATLQETQCSSAPALCDSPMPSATVSYSSGSDMVIVVDSLVGPTRLYSVSGEAVTLGGGRMFADSIVGTVEWYAKLGPTGNFYGGTFVARRRR